MKDKAKGESTKTPPTRSGIVWLTGEILGSSRRIMTLALGFGLFVWVGDAILDYFVFYKGHRTFMELLITHPPPHELYIRLIILACFIVFGVIVSFLVSKHKRTEERIIHLSQSLRATRNVNQLIIREKNRDALIQKTCNILVETRSYYNAWIVLLDENGKYLTSANTGLDNVFAPMKKLLEQGKWTECGKRALKQKELIILEDPKKECPYCPLSSAYAGQGAYSICLAYHDRICGMLSVSIPKPFIKDKQEQELIKEIAGDIGFALHNIKIEKEHKQVEEELRESENRLNILFESAPDAYYINDFEGIFIDGNKATEKLLGYSKEELIGKNFVDAGILSMDQAEIALNVLARNIKGESTGPDKYILKRKDGSTVYVEILTHPVVIKGKNRVLGIARNITERKRNEEKLAKHRDHLEESVKKRTSELERSQQALSFLLGDVNESRDNLKEKTEKLNDSLKEVEKAKDNIDAILKSIADGLIVTDLDNRILLINHVAENLLKVRLRRILNKTLNSVLKNKKLAEKFNFTVSKAEKGYQFDFELLTENTKNPHIFNARTSTIKDRKGKTTGIITVFSDVSREREIDRMKTEFISTAAHELRTPLTSIRGFSEILKTRDDLKETEKNRFIGYINRQSINLGNIIGDLLDVSRLESGLGFSLKKQKCKIFKDISNIISSFKISSPSHTFSLSLPDREKEIIVDREKIEQVMDNLLNNAVKYSPRGGNIRITVSQEKREYLITIEDQGLGMSPLQVEKAFDKFYRVDSSDTAIEGTGLGLSIVKHIIEAHDGRIWIESHSGKGTRVRFTIPLGLVKANKKKLNHIKEHIKGK